MATVQRQTVKRGAPPPARRASPPGPTVRDHSPSGKTQNSFISAFTIFMYGISGIGKSSMWAHLPNVGYLHDSQEEGILELVKFGQVPKPKWIQSVDNIDQAIDYLADVANKKYNIDSLVIESATGFEKLIFQKHCHDHYDDDWGKEGFYGYQAGPKNAAKFDVPNFLDALDNVRRSDINVVFTGHAQVKPFKNPNGPDYDQYKPYLDVETWQQIHRWAQCVLFYDLVVEVAAEKGALKKKAGDSRRVIYTQPVGSCVAKNWWGLEGCINAGESPKEAYDNFVTAYKKAARRGQS